MMSRPPKYEIEIQVRCTFVPSQSDPAGDRYFFAYTVTMTNTGSVPATLLTRHWIIEDAQRKVIEVRGDGVVGKQPRLTPGGSFQYTSGAVIETPTGTMQGSYQLQADDGTLFDAPIPRFDLCMPRTLH